MKRVEARVLRRPLVSLMLLAGLVVLLGAGAFAAAASSGAAHSVPPTRADLFMKSVVTRDGALGWHQLCPTLQARLSIEELRQQASEQSAFDVGQGITFTTEFLSAHPQAKGGEMRVYLVTAQRPDGWQAERIYIVRTQSDGCVEDVQNLDLPGDKTK